MEYSARTDDVEDDLKRRFAYQAVGLYRLVASVSRKGGILKKMVSGNSWGRVYELGIRPFSIPLLIPKILAVIPAKLVPVCFKRGAGIQFIKTGFRVKPGMTVKVKGLMTHYATPRISHGRGQGDFTLHHKEKTPEVRMG